MSFTIGFDQTELTALALQRERITNLPTTGDFNIKSEWKVSQQYATSQNMRKLLYILTISFLLTSCATIMNPSQKMVTIYTTEPSKVILNSDTFHTVDNKVNIEVKRKKEPLKITAITDSLTKEFAVDPINSFMYRSNIYFNYGVGMLVDMKNPKRYSYPQRIYINSTDTTSRYFRYGQANNKGELHLHISLPHINSFHLSPKDEETKINTGFWGISLGLDYYHSKQQFINIGFSSVLDFFVPFPAAVDISGEHELMSSSYIGLSNNHKLGRISLGYGLAYARNSWDFRYYDMFDPPPPTREPVKKSHYSLGLIFPTYLQLGDLFHIGFLYRPTFFRPTMNRKFEYERLISVDFAWKIRLKH